MWESFSSFANSLETIVVRLVRPRSMYVGIFFGLGTLVRLVRQCSHVCCYFFGLRTLVSPTAQKKKKKQETMKL